MKTYLPDSFHHVSVCWMIIIKTITPFNLDKTYYAIRLERSATSIKRKW